MAADGWLALSVEQISSGKDMQAVLKVKSLQGYHKSDVCAICYCARQTDVKRLYMIMEGIQEQIFGALTGWLGS